MTIKGVPHPIKWIDSKNGWFVPGLSMESKLKSLRKQALKYQHHLGRGVFVWYVIKAFIINALYSINSMKIMLI